MQLTGSPIRQAASRLYCSTACCNQLLPALLAACVFLLQLTKYQEQPQLLDGNLEGIVQPLAVLLRQTALSSTAQDTGSVQDICRLLHVLISVRGYKTAVRFFPHEASDLERVLQVRVLCTAVRSCFCLYHKIPIAAAAKAGGLKHAWATKVEKFFVHLIHTCWVITQEIWCSIRPLRWMLTQPCLCCLLAGAWFCSRCTRSSRHERGHQ
jgi:hypothetical protein